MEISARKDGLGCQAVYRVIGVMNGDVNYLLDEDEEFRFNAALVGSAALAVHADRNGVEYRTDTKDIDLYTNPELADLEMFRKFPLTQQEREDGSQYKYDTASSATSIQQPETFVDVITNHEAAFDWNPEDAEEVEKLLTQEVKTGEPVSEGKINVHLPELSTLRKTFQYSDRNYDDRIDMIDRMLE